MAVREYVGARYVPLFDGEWDNTKTYEPLTIVSVSNVASYTSKKFVPAGVDITDTEYWAETGVLNGQIVSLTGRVDALETKTTSCILVIGNSFTQRGCADKLIAEFDKNYVKTMGGVGFIGHTGQTTTYEDLLDAVIADTSVDKDEITDIIFVCAFDETVAWDELGDSTFKSTLDTKLSLISTKIASNFPNVKRQMITLAESRNQPYYTNSTYQAIFGVHKAFKEYANQHNFEYLGWSGFNLMFGGAAYFEGDNFHPTTAGAERIGQDILNSYFGNLRYLVKEDVKQVRFFITGNQATDKANCFIQLTPDDVHICVRNTSVTPGTAALAANDSFIALEEMNIPVPAPLAGGDRFLLATAIYNNVLATIYAGGKLKIEPHPTGGRGTIACYGAISGSIPVSGVTMPMLCDISYKI